MNDGIFAGVDVGPLLDELAAALPGTEGVVVLSTDGLELAMSSGTGAATAGHLAAVSAGLHAIADAVNRDNGGRRVDQTVVEMDYRMLVVLPLAEGALLAVLFDAVTDLTGAQERIAWFAGRLGLRTAGSGLVPAAEGDGPPAADADPQAGGSPADADPQAGSSPAVRSGGDRLVFAP